MTVLPLPALDGHSPLGFLAALGVLELLTQHTAHPARLAWSTTTGTAELHDAHSSIDDLTDELTTIVDSIPDGGVLPAVEASFPPSGGAMGRLRLTRLELADYSALATDRYGDIAERWLSSLVTDLSVDREQHGSISLFTAPSGQQSMRSMLKFPLEELRKNPEVMREALVAWRRYTGVTGEYLDHRVLHDAVDAADGESAERGVPGATWLALMSYPMMRTTSLGRGPITTCWQDLGRRGGRRMVYPLWSTPLDVAAVQALLAHPVLDHAGPGTPPSAATALSVFWVGHATRRLVPGRKSAGVLAPTTMVISLGRSRRR
jgi:hypothetical protein